MSNLTEKDAKLIRDYIVSQFPWTDTDDMEGYPDSGADVIDQLETIVGTLATVKDPPPDSEEEKINEAFRDACLAHCRDGEIEMDPGAVVSISDDGGAYVQTWLWVYNSEAGIPDEEEDEVSASVPA